MPGEIWARFVLGNKAFNVYGVSLFGKFNEIYADFMKFPNKADWWLWVDCTYFYLPLYNGILASIFFLGMLFMTIARAVRNFEYKFVLIFLWSFSTVFLRHLLLQLCLCLYLLIHSLSNLINDHRYQMLSSLIGVVISD